MFKTIPLNFDFSFVSNPSLKQEILNFLNDSKFKSLYTIDFILNHDSTITDPDLSIIKNTLSFEEQIFNLSDDSLDKFFNDCSYENSYIEDDYIQDENIEDDYIYIEDENFSHLSHEQEEFYGIDYYLHKINYGLDSLNNSIQGIIINKLYNNEEHILPVLITKNNQITYHPDFINNWKLYFFNFVKNCDFELTHNELFVFKNNEIINISLDNNNKSYQKKLDIVIR